MGKRKEKRYSVSDRVKLLLAFEDNLILLCYSFLMLLMKLKKKTSISGYALVFYNLWYLTYIDLLFLIISYFPLDSQTVSYIVLAYSKFYLNFGLILNVSAYLGYALHILVILHLLNSELVLFIDSIASCKQLVSLQKVFFIYFFE